MNTSFIHDNFMLHNKPAERLYHEFAKNMPIFDFHCHLSAKEISENKQFSNLSEIWLYGDHYKWRAMRAVGFEEKYITGSASDLEKFDAWSKTVPHTLGNPLYHWTHLEMKRYFGIDEILNEKTSKDIWEKANKKLQSEELLTQNIIKQSNVVGICTTDDPIDNLEHHIAIKNNEDISTHVLPTFRPDKAVEIQQEQFKDYINNLEKVAEIKIDSYSSLLQALEKRMDYFASVGCVVSDHGLQTLPFELGTEEEVSQIFKKRFAGEALEIREIEIYRTAVMIFLGKQYHKRGWAMQLHLGAIRNNNTRMFNEVGADSGFDSMYDFNIASSLNGFLNALDLKDELPKTIIYNLNPIHNEVIATAIGNFQSSDRKGKIQFGSGWWFNDQKTGMLKQMTDLANHGLLSLFVGMLTDSRSFLSFTRHEYFRRILCNLIGEWVEKGEVPEDYELLGKMVEDISFQNARDFFEIEFNQE